MSFLSSAQSQASNYTVEVCPEALWKDAAFLRGPSPETFANVTKWDQDQVQTYVTKTALPQAQANIAFVILAVVALIVFLLWRLVRRCCMSCCMRQSCEERRSHADPAKVLSGWGYWLQKGLLLLFSVAALAMVLAGFIIVPKNLFVKVWRPVNRLTSFVNDTTVDMENLVAGLGGINPILDGLRSIVDNDMNLPAIKASLQSIGTTLDSSAANPNTAISALDGLNTGMASIRTQIAALRPQLSASTGLPSNLTSLQGGLPGLAAAVTACNNYSTRLGGLDAPFSSLSAATGPSYNANSLDTAMTAVEVDSWRTSLASNLAALDVWRSLRSDNTLAALASSVSALSTSVTSLQTTQLPAAASGLTSFHAAWSAASASLKSLLDRVGEVQDNVAQLDAPTNRVVQQLQSVYDNITAFTVLQPSPSALAANLTALAAELSLGPAATLVSDLNAAQTAINATSQAVLDDARSTLADLKSSLDSLSPKFAATRAALDAYKAAATQVTFDALKSSAAPSGATWELGQTAKSSAGSAAASLSVQAVAAAATTGALGPMLTSVKTGMASVDAAAATSDARIAARPSLAPYQDLAASVKSVYDGMPAQKSQELAAVNSAIATVERLLVSVPVTVRNQVAAVNSSFSSGIKQLRSKLVVKAQEFQDKNAGRVRSLDLARYRVTGIVLGAAVVLVLALIIAVVFNWPWGIGFAIFVLLLAAAVLFLLAVVFVLVLVVAQDGCHHSEHIVMESLGSEGSSVAPLANYYFFADTNSSVKDVLRSANLVDIAKVEGQVTDAANSIISNITSQFNPRPKLANILTDIKAFVNTTLGRIDDLLEVTSVSSVRPIYMDLKSFPCCDLTDHSLKMWVVFTFGGWLAYISCTLAMAFLGRLDQLPQSGRCGCGYGRLLYNKVQPESRGGDEEGGAKAIAMAPGLQTMGPGDGATPPPQAAAMYYPPPPAAYYPPPPAASYPPPPAAYYPPPPPVYPPPPQPERNEVNR